MLTTAAGLPPLIKAKSLLRAVGLKGTIVGIYKVLVLPNWAQRESKKVFILIVQSHTLKMNLGRGVDDVESQLFDMESRSARFQVQGKHSNRVLP
jgi:hypothetical protein